MRNGSLHPIPHARNLPPHALPAHVEGESDTFMLYVVSHLALILVAIVSLWTGVGLVMGIFTALFVKGLFDISRAEVFSIIKDMVVFCALSGFLFWIAAVVWIVAHAV